MTIFNPGDDFIRMMIITKTKRIITKTKRRRCLISCLLVGLLCLNRQRFLLRVAVHCMHLHTFTLIARASGRAGVGSRIAYARAEADDRRDTAGARVQPHSTWKLSCRRHFWSWIPLRYYLHVITLLSRTIIVHSKIKAYAFFHSHPSSPVRPLTPIDTR